jgi:hypothetical protein
MEIECTFVCAHCLQINATVVDPTGGVHQEYIEDCQVCCRPNLLYIDIDSERMEVKIEAEVGH